MQEIIQAPNGTRFLKPEFECKLYEEINGYIYGRVGEGVAKWYSDGVAITAHLNLTPAPRPWYNNLGKGKLCYVGTYPYIALITQELNGRYFDSNGEHWAEAKPLTKEEALEYIAKE